MPGEAPRWQSHVRTNNAATTGNENVTYHGGGGDAGGGGAQARHEQQIPNQERQEMEDLRMSVWSSIGRNAYSMLVPSNANAVATNVLQKTQDAVDDVTHVVSQVAASNSAKEIDRAAKELFCGILEEFYQLAIVKKFEDEPSNAICPLANVAFMMGCIGCCFTFTYMPAMHVSPLCFTSVVFHGSFALAFWCYHEGVVTHAGGVPSNWKPVADGSRPKFARKNPSLFQPLERKKTEGGGYRFDKFEGKFKPDRAHFCKPMKQIILRMDHYCPWLGNCVGHKNHKFFVQTIFYDALAANIANLSMIHALHVGGHSAMHTFMLSQGVVTASIVSVVLTPFFLFHCWLLSKNLTTIEYCESGAIQHRRSPYDVGMWENISDVMGSDWQYWLVPTTPEIGDGLFWKVAPQFEAKKKMPANMMNTVRVTAPKPGIQGLDALGTALAASEKETSDSDEDDEVAGDLSTSSRRKCGFARGAKNTCVAEEAAQTVLAGVSMGLASVPQHLDTMLHVSRDVIDSVHVPNFIKSGVAGYCECGNDLYNYSATQGHSLQEFCSRSLMAWLAPSAAPPAPRIASTVTDLHRSPQSP